MNELRQRQPQRHIRTHESPVAICGQRYGTMVVLHFAPEASARHRRTYWRIRCDCGKEMDKRWVSIRDGIRCGSCTPIIHGEATRRQGKTAEWVTWRNMIDRCTRQTNKDFCHYGGRGITVCIEWQVDYLSFLSCMGRKPTPKHTIERKDVNGNYEPNNCVWALQRDQVNNRRNTLKVNFQGHDMTMADAARLVGLPRNVVYVRMSKLGWAADQALTTPILEYGVRRPK